MKPLGYLMVACLVVTCAACTTGEKREPKLASDTRVAYSEFRQVEDSDHVSMDHTGTFQLDGDCLKIVVERPIPDEGKGPFVAVFHTDAATIEGQDIVYVYDGQPIKRARLGEKVSLGPYEGILKAKDVEELKLPAACGNPSEVAVFHNYPLYKK